MSKIVYNNKKMVASYLGTRKIVAIYLGNKLVWQLANSVFAAGYWLNGLGWTNTGGWK